MNGLHYPFTPRQAEVLQALAEGMAAKEIAERLRIDTSSVNGHIERLSKLTGHSGRRLVVFAVKWVGKREPA